MKKKTLYRCFSCPALFAGHMELTEHRLSHAHPDEDFWTWYRRRHGYIETPKKLGEGR